MTFKLENLCDILMITQQEFHVSNKIQKLLLKDNNSHLDMYISYSAGLIYLRTKKLISKNTLNMIKCITFAYDIFVDEEVNVYVFNLRWKPCHFIDDNIKEDCKKMINGGLKILNDYRAFEECESLDILMLISSINQDLSIYTLGL